jgi:hypothetical protein
VRSPPLGAFALLRNPEAASEALFARRETVVVAITAAPRCLDALIAIKGERRNGRLTWPRVERQKATRLGCRRQNALPYREVTRSVPQDALVARSAGAAFERYTGSPTAIDDRFGESPRTVARKVRAGHLAPALDQSVLARHTRQRGDAIAGTVRFERGQARVRNDVDANLAGDAARAVAAVARSGRRVHHDLRTPVVPSAAKRSARGTIAVARRSGAASRRLGAATGAGLAAPRGVRSTGDPALSC